MRFKSFPDKNYKACFFNGKTIRFDIGNPKELEWPEFYDIKITGKCEMECKYCYQSSAKNSSHYKCLMKLDRWFGSMSKNQKPFQIAYGGGEPTWHPDFGQIMRMTHGHGITPNYTTNGMFIDEPYEKKVLSATVEYCGGVAVTVHQNDIWKKAVEKLKNYTKILNLHILISDKISIDRFKNIYNETLKDIKYYVLLPLVAQGRCKKAEIDYKYLKAILKNVDMKKIAFGAKFYDYIKYEKDFKLSLYEPELFSKYLDCEDWIFYKSSFDV